MKIILRSIKFDSGRVAERYHLSEAMDLAHCFSMTFLGGQQHVVLLLKKLEGKLME